MTNGYQRRPSFGYKRNDFLATAPLLAGNMKRSIVIVQLVQVNINCEFCYTLCMRLVLNRTIKNMGITLYTKFQ